jgi:hypothetical protein
MRDRGEVSVTFFVERMKLYHNLKVHEKCVVIYQDANLEKKTPEGNEKTLSLILSASYFLSIILTVQLISVPHYDGS